MESFGTMSLLDCFNLFPLVTRLLSEKYRRLSYFVYVIYLSALVKLKLKSLKIKAVDIKLFKSLVAENNYNNNFHGDINGCALVSLNTLIALSLRSGSWIRIFKLNNSENKPKLNVPDNQTNVFYHIVMPPVRIASKEWDGSQVNSYLIQCVCVSSVLDDFVLYVSDNKLFNISRMGCKNDEYCDLVNRVGIEIVDVDIFPTVAKSATVSGISSADNIISDDVEYILSQHFKKPRLLRVGDVFHICQKKYFSNLSSDFSCAQDIYFKVIKLSGEEGNKISYILKDYTSLYLNPPVNGYLPQKYTTYVASDYFSRGQTITFCPEGLLQYYQKLRRIFKPFLGSSKIETNPMFLLCGPKGSGKKTTLKAVAASFGLHVNFGNCFDFYALSPSLAKGKLHQLFTKARRTLPCVVYLENVELLGREQNYHENTRHVDIFVTEINSLLTKKLLSYPLFVVGSTSLKSTELLPAIARLFVETITFGVLNVEDSYKTLQWLAKSSNANYSCDDLLKVAKKAKGYVFADLVLLMKQALRFRLQDKSVPPDNLELLLNHFDQAKEIMDSAYSDYIGAAHVPTVRWEDVGGLANLKEEIMVTLNLPLKHPELFSSGLKRSGIMFYGPPGTGKTLMAKAIATECNYNFLSVKGPELMNMYVGESERNIREVFERARNAAPCIIFFDELDSLAPCRGKSGDSGGVTDRVVSQLLAEMDGLDRNKDVFVLGATNRPDLVDPALLRPGRFDKMFYVGICDDKISKLNILKALTRRFALDGDVDLEKVSEKLPEQVTGADLYSVASNAWFSAARKAVNAIEKGEKVQLPLVIQWEDFSEAVNQFVPSLSVEDIEYYEKLKASEGR